MRGPALLFAILLLLPAATAGAPEADFQVFYSERASRFVADGLVAEGETRGYRFLIAQENVTRVEFHLTWSETGDRAGLSGPDVFSLTAQDADGRPLGVGERAATGEARLASASVNPLPRDGPVEAARLEAHLRENTGTKGQGDWRAWVKLEDAGNPEGATVDKDNRFQLVAIVHFYEAVPLRVVSLDAPSNPVGIAGVAEDVPLGWALGMAALALCALGLAGLIFWQARSRGRRSSNVSPDGEKTTTPGR